MIVEKMKICIRKNDYGLFLSRLKRRLSCGRGLLLDEKCLNVVSKGRNVLKEDYEILSDNPLLRFNFIPSGILVDLDIDKVLEVRKNGRKNN